MAQARRRVGAEPLHWLFDLLRGPAAGIGTAGAWWRGPLVCAIDGTTMAVPDSPANLTAFTKHRCKNGGSGYPATFAHEDGRHELRRTGTYVDLLHKEGAQWRIALRRPCVMEVPPPPGNWRLN